MSRAAPFLSFLMSNPPDSSSPSITTTQEEVQRFVAAQVAAHDSKRNAEFAAYLQGLQHEQEAERTQWEARRAAEANSQRAETERLNNVLVQLQFVSCYNIFAVPCSQVS